MFRTRWYKVFFDLWHNKARTLLVALAIAVGVFSVGFVSNARAILVRELGIDLERAQPAAGTLFTTPITAVFADRISEMPEVSMAEGRNSIRARVQVGPDEWRNIILVAIPRIETHQIDRVTPVAGAWPPQRGEILLERLAVDYVRSGVGEMLAIQFEDGTRKHGRVSGLVHDPQLVNADIMNTAFGYITADTLASWGIRPADQFTELRFRVAANENDLAHLEAVADQIEKQIENNGGQVLGRNIPNPGERPIQEVIDTLVLLLTGFGFIILFLASFLVVNTITALLTQQTKQIGVMKLVGGRRRQIISMYVVLVLVFSLIALAIGIPPSIIIAQQIIIHIVEDLLNVRPDSYAVPLSIILMQISVGLFIPLLGASFPLLKGINITTHKALNDTGIGADAYGHGRADRLFQRLQRRFRLQRPLIISLRNSIRHKGRLLLTLFVLVIGGALFMGVLSVRASVDLTINNFMRFHQYDMLLSFNRDYRLAQLEGEAWQVAGVTAVETWHVRSHLRQRPDGTESDNFQIFAVPPDTDYMNPTLLDGRWLTNADQNSIVVNSDLLQAEPDLAVGDTLILSINGRDVAWEIVGVAPTQAVGAMAYVPREVYNQAARQIGRGNRLQIRIDPSLREAGQQELLLGQLVNRFDGAGYLLSNSRTTESLQATNQLTFDLIVAFLVMMALLLAIVGGLGLTTTMSINILERIREIGVLRAIGASNEAVRQIVLAEGLFIGLLSWLVGFFLSWPTAVFMSQQVGLALLNTPLDFTFAWSSVILWLVLVMFLAVAASLGPARRAVSLTIREVLAYE